MTILLCRLDDIYKEEADENFKPMFQDAGNGHETENFLKRINRALTRTPGSRTCDRVETKRIPVRKREILWCQSTCARGKKALRIMPTRG